MAVDENGDGAVVVDFDQHALLKATGVYLDPLSAKQLHECVHQRLCLFGRSGVGEAGATSLACTGVEGELADNQCLAVSFQQREIELVCLVAEDTEVCDLLREVSCVSLGVTCTDAEED